MVDLPCPICGQSAQGLIENVGQRIEVTWCRRCGHYRITGSAVQEFKPIREQTRSYERMDPDQKITFQMMPESAYPDILTLNFLSCHTRQESEDGRRAEITPKNWRDLANRHAATSVRHNQEMLLRYLARKAGRPSGFAPIALENDFTVIDCGGPGSLQWYLDALQKKELIRGFTYGQTGLELTIEPTVDGWELLDPLLRNHIEPGRVFVAWSFQEDKLFDEAIAPAVRKAGGRPEPAQNPKTKENREITEHIRSEIVRAEVVVADCTGHRPNVYFEIGYAMGLGRPVVLTCRKKEWDQEQHFDTRQYPHLVWKDLEELKKELPDWLRPRLAHKAPKG